MIGGSVGDLYIRIWIDGRTLRAGIANSAGAAAAGGRQLGNIFNASFSSTVSALKVFAIPLMIASAIRSMFAFEQRMRQVRINARLLGQEGEEAFQKIQDKARELAGTTPFDPEQVADAMNILSLAGLSANTILESSADILNMAIAGQIELSRSAEIATASMKMFNLTAKDMEYISDVLVGTQSRARVNMSELSDAMLKIGPLARKMGMSFDELAATMAIMGERSHSILIQADALKNAILKLTDPSDKTSEQLKDLGINMENFTKNGEIQILDLMDAFTKLNLTTKQINVLFRARGSQMVTLFQAINEGGQQGVEAVRALAKAVREDAGFAAKAAAYANLSLINRLKELKSTFYDLVIEILGPVAESFRGWVAALTMGIRAISQFNQATGGFISTSLTIIAQFKAMEFAVKSLTKSYATLKLVMFGRAGTADTPKIKGWLTPMRVALLLIVAIAAAFVGLLSKGKASEESMKRWGEAVNKLKFAWQEFKMAIAGFKSAIIEGIAATFGKNIDSMKTSLLDFVTTAVEGFAWMVGEMADWMNVLRMKSSTIWENFSMSFFVGWMKFKRLFASEAKAAVMDEVIKSANMIMVQNMMDVFSLKDSLSKARADRFKNFNAKKPPHEPRRGEDPPRDIVDAAAAAAKSAIQEVMDTHRSGFVEFGTKLQDALLNKSKEDQEAKRLALAEKAVELQNKQLDAQNKTNSLLDDLKTFGSLTGSD